MHSDQPHSMTPGRLLLRVHQFNEQQRKKPRNGNADVTKQFWRDFVVDFFEHESYYRYMIWQPEEQIFAMYVLSRDTIPRFFEVLYNSGISSITHVLHNPREYAVWTHKYLLISTDTEIIYDYDNGNKIIMYGALRIVFSQHLMVRTWEFEAQRFEQCFTGNQGEWLNSSIDRNIGLPDSVMRFFEIIRTITHMKPLFEHSIKTGCTPRESLRRYHRNDDNNNNPDV
eukprot:TRINITY_DN5587_c0_g1_i2.p1 TRINITY_DN5587_c0_g1~~TRINITY_DN5587_c0_g1_i2.p1  ORF type:complete len:227 (+),score=34.98 TRINITY_DN5587_c0_g1_i2:19-699(+)